MTLADTGWTNEQCVVVGGDELQGSEFEHLAFGQPRVVAPIEVLDVFAFGKPGERVAALEQA